jgi:hypothetical protein
MMSIKEITKAAKLQSTLPSPSSPEYVYVSGFRV